MSILAVVTLVTAGVASAQTTLTFTGEDVDGNLVGIDNSYFYSGCYMPVKIRLNPDGNNTTSIDVKYFLSGSFDYQADTTNYTGFSTGTFQNYYVFTNPDADDRIGTGTAQSGQALWVDGREYDYINARNDDGTFVNGSTYLDVATLYLKPTGTTGYLNFYYLGAKVNLDDSNVSSGYDDAGTNDFTQYDDVLAAVAGTGSYTVVEVDVHECPFNPFAEQGTTYVSRLGTGLDEAALNKEDNNFTGVQTYGLITSAVNDNYSGAITHKGGNDYTTGDYTAYNTWTLWTNKPIILTFTGNNYPLNGVTTNDIRLTDTSFLGATLSLNGEIAGPDTRSGTKEFIITENVETAVTFENRIDNEGSYYASGAEDYYAEFYIDVFRYDTQYPRVTGTVISEGDGYKFVALSGQASTDAFAGEHADFTEDDDRYRIIGFSGTNTTKYAYNSTTGYNSDLNDNYVRGENQQFTMTKTGGVYTTLWVIPSATGAIKFTETWSGYIYVSDIAGNVTGVFMEIDVEPVVRMDIYASLAFRDAANDLSTTGEIRLAYKDGSDWTFTHNSIVAGDDKIVLNSAGTGFVNMQVPSSGQEYLIVMKATGAVSIGFTGIWTNDITDTSTNFFDFRSGAHNDLMGDHSTIYPNIVYENTGYIIAGDITWDAAGAYDVINAGDLTLINDSLTIWVFSNPFWMDFDLNDTINAIEQAVIIQYHLQDGWINEYANWVDFPPKATSTGFNNTL